MPGPPGREGPIGPRGPKGFVISFFLPKKKPELVNRDFESIKLERSSMHAPVWSINSLR